MNADWYLNSSEDPKPVRSGYINSGKGGIHDEFFPVVGDGMNLHSETDRTSLIVTSNSGAFSAAGEEACALSERAWVWFPPVTPDSEHSVWEAVVIQEQDSSPLCRSPDVSSQLLVSDYAQLLPLSAFAEPTYQWECRLLSLLFCFIYFFFKFVFFF